MNKKFDIEKDLKEGMIVEVKDVITNEWKEAKFKKYNYLGIPWKKDYKFIVYSTFDEMAYMYCRLKEKQVTFYDVCRKLYDDNDGKCQFTNDIVTIEWVRGNTCFKVNYSGNRYMKLSPWDISVYCGGEWHEVVEEDTTEIDEAREQIRQAKEKLEEAEVTLRKLQGE
jgi:hypothetical protein